MKKDNLYDSLESLLNETFDIAKTSADDFFLSDMYINIDLDDSKISIFDDIFSEILVKDVEDLNDVDGYKKVETYLKDILNKFKQKGKFSELDILEPFSVSIVDKDKSVKSVLMIIDEDKEIIPNSFLENIDKDLDDFIAGLIS